MPLGRFLDFLKGNENDDTVKVTPGLFDENNPFIIIQQAKKRAKGALLKNEENNPSEGEGFLKSDEALKGRADEVEDAQDTTADNIANVLSQLGDQNPTLGASLLTQNNLQEVQIDSMTRILVPKYLRTADLFKGKINTEGGIALGDISDKILNFLVKIEIELETSVGKIKTDIHVRMNINGRNMSLFEYISQSPSNPVPMVA